MVGLYYFFNFLHLIWSYFRRKPCFVQLSFALSVVITPGGGSTNSFLLVSVLTVKALQSFIMK